MAAVIITIIGIPGVSPAQVPEQYKPSFCFYTCFLPLGFCLDALSQWRHGRETVKVTVLSREVTFRKNRLYYYSVIKKEEPRMVDFGEMVRDHEFPVGERVIRFSAGNIKFYKTGPVMYGDLAQYYEFIVNNVKVRLKSGRAGFHENGALMHGILRNRTEFVIGGEKFTFGPGQAEFYPSGLLKSGNSPGRHVLRSGKRELVINSGYYAEFNREGKLEKISTPLTTNQGPVRISVGGRNIDFQYAAFAPDLSILNAHLRAPAKIMTGSGEFIFTAQNLSFHVTGAMKSGILPAGTPLSLKGGDVIPENDVDAAFREDGTLEKLFFPDKPFRRGGKIIRNMAGEKLVCSYIVFDSLGWISEAYLEHPAVFREDSQTVRIRGRVRFHPGETLREGCLLGEQILMIGGRRKLCSGMIGFREGGKVTGCESMRNAK